MANEVIELSKTIAKPFETLRTVAYWDPVVFLNKKPAGYPTQGYGRLLLKCTKLEVMKKFNLDSMQADQWLQERYPEISIETAEEWIDTDMYKAYKAVLRLTGGQLSPTQCAAVTDFAFNLGSGALQASTLLRKIKRGELSEVPDEFLKWNKAGGVILRGLTRRCKMRAAMFCS